MTHKKLRANVDRHHICPLRASLYVHSNYQVQGAYAHPGQQSVSDLIEAISLATKTFQLSDDPIRLQVPYDHNEVRISKPPDCMTSKLIGIMGVACCFIIPVLQALIRLAWLLLSRVFYYESPPSATHVDAQPKPCLCCKHVSHTVLATDTVANDAFSFDTNRVSFIIDNSATCIISNQRELFVGRLKSVQVSMTTCEGYIAKKRYLGTLRLALTDDSNKTHSYDIQDCIYDPDSPVNIVGIPVLSEFVDDAAN